jgi:toxin ParE1/3/4
VGVVRYSKSARDDILDIWLWIAHDSNVSLADDIVTRIERCAARLADYPELGVARPEIAPDARSLVAERWLVLYRVEIQGVQITRVVDGVRDLRKLIE